MKKSIISALIILTILLACGMAQSNILSLDGFSVLIPNGWTAEQSYNSVTLTKDEFPDEEVAITISCKPISKNISLDDGWNRIKSVMFNEENIIMEGEDFLCNAVWKKIEIKHLLCNKDVRKLVLFSINNNNRYLIQFDSPAEKQEEMLKIFESVMQTLKIKG